MRQPIILESFISNQYLVNSNNSDQRQHPSFVHSLHVLPAGLSKEPPFHYPFDDQQHKGTLRAEPAVIKVQRAGHPFGAGLYY